jgi:Tfp pilus assembly protein PilF
MQYNMKKIMIMLASAAITVSVSAQTTQDGIKMYNYKKYRSAERVLAPLAATDVLANYYLGLSYLDAGDAATANSYFTKYPEDLANISGTARVAFASKDAAKGMQISKDLAAKARKKEWLPLKYAADAITYTTGGDYNQAIAWYKDALTKSDDAELHTGLGDAYRKISGGGGEAMDNYEHITEKDPNNSLVLSRIGDLWYEARNYQSALDNYAKAKEADKNDPLPYHSLANAYSRSGRYQLALQNLKQYLQLSDSTFNDKMEYLRGLYLAQSFCDASVFAQSIQNDGRLTKDQKIEVTGILGYSQAECGDSIQALNTLHSYFQMQNPSKILSGDYLQYGKLFMKLGKLDSAGYYYTKGIGGDTSQNKTDVYREIAEAFKTKKDYCKSADWYNNLVKANPETQPADYAWRGIMYYYCAIGTSLKEVDTAMKAFDDFAKKYPTQPSPSYWQGRCQQLIDSEATTGAAVPYFIKWLDIVGPNYEKKNDLKGAYDYLLFYYYNKKDKENETMYKEKIKAIDPNDNVLKQIEDVEKQSAAPPHKKAK